MQEDDLKHFEEVIDKLAINGYQTKLYKDEDEDGEERPDLNLCITKMWREHQCDAICEKRDYEWIEIEE